MRSREDLGASKSNAREYGKVEDSKVAQASEPTEQREFFWVLDGKSYVTSRELGQRYAAIHT